MNTGLLDFSGWLALLALLPLYYKRLVSTFEYLGGIAFVNVIFVFVALGRNDWLSVGINGFWTALFAFLAWRHRDDDDDDDARKKRKRVRAKLSRVMRRGSKLVEQS